MVPGSPLGGVRLAGSPPTISFSLILAHTHSTTKGDQEAAVHPFGEPTVTPLSPLVHTGLPVKHGPGKPEGPLLPVVPSLALMAISLGTLSLLLSMPPDLLHGPPGSSPLSSACQLPSACTLLGPLDLL